MLPWTFCCTNATSPSFVPYIIFKGHLVTWVSEYLVLVHGKSGAAAIMADIDRRYVHLLNTSDTIR
jgi:hypothetical protein